MSGRLRMRLQPKRAGMQQRIDAGAGPPGGLVATAMNFTMVASAQWHGEFVADLQYRCRRIRETPCSIVTGPREASSLLRFAAIQGFEREQDLTDLAP